MLLKIMVFLLMLSILCVIREFYKLAKACNNKETFDITYKRLLMFGISLAYILTIVFTGFII